MKDRIKFMFDWKTNPQNKQSFFVYLGVAFIITAFFIIFMEVVKDTNDANHRKLVKTENYSEEYYK